MTENSTGDRPLLHEERVGWVCPKCKTSVSPEEKVCPKCSVSSLETEQPSLPGTVQHLYED